MVLCMSKLHIEGKDEGNFDRLQNSNFLLLMYYLITNKIYVNGCKVI